MATANKTATTPVTLSTLKGEAEVQRDALDNYLKAEDKATAASAKKKTTKAILMGVTSHGDVIVATDGRSRRIENEHVATNQHQKVALLLAAKYKVSDAEMKKLYKQTAGSKHVQEVTKF